MECLFFVFVLFICLFLLLLLTGSAPYKDTQQQQRNEFKEKEK